MLQRIRPGVRCVLMSDQSPYWRRTLGLKPLAYWPLWETEGSVIHCLTDPAMNGTHTNCTLAATTGPDGNPAPSFNGTTSKVNVFSAALASAINMDELTLHAWAKIPAGAWTDGSNRYAVTILDSAETLFAYLRKDSTNNTIRGGHSPSGSVTVPTAGNLAWFSFGVTVSVSANKLYVYYNGTPSTPTGAAHWANPVTDAWIGVWNETLFGAFSGNLAHVSLFDRALPASEMNSLQVL